MAEGKGHTELPWRKDGDQFSSGAIKGTRNLTAYLVGGKDGSNPTIFVSSMVSSKAEQSQFCENIDLIVTAVNTYPAVEGLVKALEFYAEYFEDEILGDLARTALSRFRSLQNGGAND